MYKALVIEKDKLAENIRLLQERMAEKKIIAVLKGNGYGLGLLEYSAFLQENGIDFFAVSDPQEALQLWENGCSCEILLLSPVTNGELAKQLIDKHIILTVHSYENAKLYESAAAELNVVAPVHIKVDTGFGRFGFRDMQEIPKVCKLSSLSCDGIYSHFSCSFEKKYDITNRQFRKFEEVLAFLSSFGIDIPMKHIGNSSAALRFPETRLNAVRIGSAFLGRLSYNEQLPLNRIAYLESRVLTVDTLPAHHNVGYGNTYYTKHPTKIAVIPVGYQDGYKTEKSRDTFRVLDILRYMYQDLRQLGKRHWISIRGESYPLIGRVGMYNVVADVTNSEVQIGDVVRCDINPILIDSRILREYR